MENLMDLKMVEMNSSMMNVSNASNATSNDSFGIFGQLFDTIADQGDNTIMDDIRLAPFISYCYSWYGMACMAMAVVLNRTLVIASTNNIRIQQTFINTRRNLSGDGNITKFLKYASVVGFRLFAIGYLLYNAYNILITLNLNSKLIGKSEYWIYRILDNVKMFNYDVETTNVNMKTPKTQVMIGPSTDIYWPTFLGFCLLVYIETFISTINGDKPYTETGLTIFEHSLAFQEASFKGTVFMGNRNVTRRPTEELLIICLFSTLNHLNIQIGGLINKNKYRLIPSTIIGFSFLCYFVKLLFNGQWVQFPAIITCSIFPQILIILIMFVSTVIFAMAILATGLNFQDLNYAKFFTLAGNDRDFQERTFLKLSDDFYTTLINLGMLSITLAGKSSYMNELGIVAIDEETWIEKTIWEKLKNNLNSINGNYNSEDDEFFNKLKGYNNIISNPSTKLISDIGNNLHNTINNNNGLFNDSDAVIKRRTQSLQILITDLFQLLKGLFLDKFLYKYILKKYVLEEKIEDYGSYEDYEKLQKRVPMFLRKYVQSPLNGNKGKDIIKNDKLIEIDDINEQELSTGYLRYINQEFSENDNSEDFKVNNDDESELESIIDDDERSEYDELISPEQFIELINDDMNVDILNSHLKNNDNKIMTRSRFNKLQVSSNSNIKDETTTLIEILLSKRQGNLTKILNNQNFDDEGFDSNLYCVVCQVHTREFITWPCKCFAICETCRLTLAAKGIEGCVCCRRPIDGVSKVFIP